MNTKYIRNLSNIAKPNFTELENEATDLWLEKVDCRDDNFRLNPVVSNFNWFIDIDHNKEVGIVLKNDFKNKFKRNSWNLGTIKQ